MLKSSSAVHWKEAVVKDRVLTELLVIDCITTVIAGTIWLVSIYRGVWSLGMENGSHEEKMIFLQG